MKDYKPKFETSCFICTHPEVENDLVAFENAKTLGLKICKKHLDYINELYSPET